LSPDTTPAISGSTASAAISSNPSAAAGVEGPLNPAELAALDAALLPSRERHQLRLLAHGLRTLQQIAGRRAGPPPQLAAIQAWARQQPSIGDDETFVSAFSIQLQVAGQQLSQLAGDRPGGALALELSELINAAQRQSQAPQS
jgi:hypothetical protein